MRKNILFLSFFVLVVYLGLVNTSFAYKGDPSARGPYHTPEKQAEMLKIMQDNDYDAWVKIMSEKNGGKRLLDVVNKENFSDFAKSWILISEGKKEEAMKIRQDLGLSMGGGQMNNGAMKDCPCKK